MNHTGSLSHSDGFVLKPQSASNLIRHTEPLKWLVEDVLPLGRCLMLTAPSGVGKSWVSLDLAISVDQGEHWLGHFPCQQGKVLVVDEENGAVGVRERLMKLLKGRRIEVDQCNIEFITLSGLSLSNPSHVTEMSRILSDIRPSLVVLDTLIRIHQVEESSASEMAKVDRIFKNWYVKYGCALCINHHTRKPSISGHSAQHGFRGSSEIQAFVDSHIDLSAKEQGKLTAYHAKARFAKAVDTFGISIEDVDEESVVIKYTEPPQKTKKIESVRESILGLIKSDDWVPRTDIIDSLDYGKNAIDPALKSLVDDGFLEKETQGNKVLFRLKSSSSL